MLDIKPKTPGDDMSEETIIVQLDSMDSIADALSSKSRLMILKLLSEEKMNITCLAEKLNISTAAVSQQVKILEKAGLIGIYYTKGTNGIRKVCSTSIKQVVFDL